MQWHEWVGQFESAKDSQFLTDDVTLWYLQALVPGEAKTAIADFTYCGVMCRNALKTFERKFGQPQAAKIAAQYERDLVTFHGPKTMGKVDTH